MDPAYLEQAQRDATLLAIRAQEEAGLDILTDGEMCRESYSNRFATRSSTTLTCASTPAAHAATSSMLAGAAVSYSPFSTNQATRHGRPELHACKPPSQAERPADPSLTVTSATGKAARSPRPATTQCAAIRYSTRNSDCNTWSRYLDEGPLGNDTVRQQVLDALEKLVATIRNP